MSKRKRGTTKSTGLDKLLVVEGRVYAVQYERPGTNNYVLSSRLARVLGNGTPEPLGWLHFDTRGEAVLAACRLKVLFPGGRVRLRDENFYTLA